MSASVIEPSSLISLVSCFSYLALSASDIFVCGVSVASVCAKMTSLSRCVIPTAVAVAHACVVARRVSVATAVHVALGSTPADVAMADKVWRVGAAAVGAARSGAGAVAGEDAVALKAAVADAVKTVLGVDAGG
jgi:hypothetical protein